ncbi:hypothetical protein CVT24_005803 [Panaeolus cyanescens]|uniref:Cytochrome P450 n=1 Tax=Panaeolus cyanescens TaxID=181874 RepID=A0A409V942_9AGAR|nr:hypothetical protein CVT24_005803 [Panaeolus cyanescens]
MAFSTLTVLFVSGLLWFTSRLFCRYTSSSPLDTIPGPLSESLIFDPGIAKIKGFLGGNVLFISDPLALHHVLVKLRNTLLQIAKDGPKEVDLMDWMTRTALELIGQSGLGFTFDTLAEGSQPHPYGIASKQLVPVSTESALISTILVPYLSKIGTRRFRRFIVDIFPSKVVRRTRDIIDVLHNTSVEIFESKKKALREGDEALAAQIGKGKDIISILMKANMEAAEEDQLSEEELLGQITSLTFAATDTTSTALARTFHLLSQHKDVQNRLRLELRQARQDNNGEDLSYDILVSLPYLDAICRETLRLPRYPPVHTIVRTARKDMILPLSTPIRGTDGNMVSQVAVPRNTDIYVSILSSNRNKQLWGNDACEWKPERWLEPLPDSLVNARIPGVYSHLLTFIGGGRSCIGFKFSQLEMKAVLALLIDCLEVSPGNKDIIWQMTGIVTPNVNPDSTIPTMPLVLQKDQNVYEESEIFIASNRMMFGEGIFTTLGEPHRRQRRMLNPVFSIAHMRNMVLIFYDVVHKVDVMEWMTRTALELIGQSGLGFSFDSLIEGSLPHPYGVASKQLVPLSSSKAVIFTTFLPFLSNVGTRNFRRFVVDQLAKVIGPIRMMRDIVDVLHTTSVEIYESKKKAIQEGDEAVASQIGQGKDIISILMKANMHASNEDRLSEEELLGQITSLTFAATDTTSTALARTIHLLSENKDVQTRLRAELKQARDDNNGQDLPYDSLVHLPYLDAICRETLRLYPPLATISRTARQDMTLPLSSPIKGVDGNMISEITVPNGTDVFISIITSNRNVDLWGPDAYEWKPERWLQPLPDELVDAHIPGIYSHLLTFLGGGRSCIGFKFSQLEMKVVLALLIDELEFSPGKKPVIWQMTGIATPNIDPDSTVPTMPLTITRVKSIS